MRIGFVSPPALGHFNPTSAVARRLQARGHDVAMIAAPRAEPLARAAGLPFIPFGGKAFQPEKVSEIVGRLGRLSGEEGLRFTCELIAEESKVKWKEFPKLLPAHGIEALVLDDYHFYSAAIPKRLGLPYAVLANALHFDYSGRTPLCVYGWTHADVPAAIERNRRGVARFTEMLRRLNAELIAEAEAAGIEADWDDPSSFYSNLPWITQCPREFDFDNADWPEHFHHAGPFHDGNGRPAVEFPWDRLTGEPMVYASMGSIQVGDGHVFRTIVSAAAKLPGTQLVLAMGNLLRPDDVGPVPSNAIVVNTAPQLELLKRASLCVTHAGFNTVLEALSQGVPQVAIPVTNDQPGVAARIADKGTGIVAPLHKLSAFHLSTLIREVLNAPVYRANARRLQAAIAQTDGLSRAADLLEEGFGLSRDINLFPETQAYDH